LCLVSKRKVGHVDNAKFIGGQGVENDPDVSTKEGDGDDDEGEDDDNEGVD
jgi:hypothetical protein